MNMVKDAFSSLRARARAAQGVQQRLARESAVTSTSVSPAHNMNRFYLIKHKSYRNVC